MTLARPRRPLLTTRQAAERLGIPQEAVRALCRSGQLSAIRLPSRDGRGRLRIRPGSLDAYEREQR